MKYYGRVLVEAYVFSVLCGRAAVIYHSFTYFHRSDERSVKESVVYDCDSGNTIDSIAARLVHVIMIGRP